MKLSIIIPVYRAEDTLERCIGSIQQQSFTSYELILVDDGSPDNSGEICDKYAALDSRIKVLHKKNGGACDARNKGLEMVTGEYLSIIDGDDWLECTLPEGFEWILPAGKITPIVGEPLYISGFGEHLSRQAYRDKYDIDPEIAYQLMRGSSRVRTAAMAYAGKQRVAATVSSKRRSESWLDEDDWTS